MRKKRKAALGSTSGDLSMREVETVVKALAKQLQATKKLYFTHQGVVIETREVPDHYIQLRAGRELAKMMGLYPGRGACDRTGLGDYCGQPVINLVMPGIER